MQAAQNSTDRRKVQKALEERARAKQSLHTGLADGVYASHFQKLRLQAREGERRDAVARNERIDAAVLSHKINARFALWKDQFDTEMKASIDVVFAMGWNCGSQLGLNATDVTPEPNEGDSSSSDAKQYMVKPPCTIPLLLASALIASASIDDAIVTIFVLRVASSVSVSVMSVSVSVSYR